MTQATQTDSKGVTQKRWAVTLECGGQFVTWAPSKKLAAAKFRLTADHAEPIDATWRVPRRGTQTEQVNLRVSSTERAAMIQRAEAAGMTLTKFIIQRCA